MKTIALFNNKGGVGKTSLVYHLAWMFSGLGLGVLAVDLDPQANLTAAFVDEEELEQLFGDTADRKTIFGAIRPLKDGEGDIADPYLKIINERLALIVGDLFLSQFEDQLSEVWPKCLDRDARAFRVMSAFWRTIQKAVHKHKASIVFIDVGPNLGAINRSALIASDHVIVPLAPDLFSLQGLRNLGPTLRSWRDGWKKRLKENPRPNELELPAGRLEPIGYVVLQHAVRLDRPTRAYERWARRIPEEYRQSVLNEREPAPMMLEDDPHCLAMLKHYRSLMPLAQDARKPVFHLRPADGAIGSHAQAAIDAGKHFVGLAEVIARRIGIALPVRHQGAVLG